MSRRGSTAPGLRRFWVAVGVVLVGATCLRVAVVVAASDFAPCCDADDYIRHGISIADGEGYPESILVADGGPTALRPPLYPLMLGAVFAASDDNRTAARVVQALLGTVVVALAALLAYQVFGRRRLAFTALVLAAIYPPLVLGATAFMSEALFLPLALAAVVGAWKFREEPRLRWTLVAGLLCGLAALTRQTGVLVLVPVGVAVLATPGLGRRQRAGAASVLVGVAALTVAPWTIRNAAVFHEFVPVGAQTGLQLAGIYSDEVRTDPQRPAVWVPPSVIARYQDLFTRRGIDELELDRELRRRAVSYARDHPGYVAEAVVRNSLRMLHIGNPASERVGAQTLNLTPGQARWARFGFGAAAVLAVAGASTAAARRVPLWFWLSPLPFFAVAAVTAGLLRYRAPLDPFVLIAAAPAVAWLWDHLTRRGSAPAPEPELAPAR